MEAKLLSFGLLEVEGKRYDHDVVIDNGQVSRRRKGPSKPYRDEFGHTPLTTHEDIPWSPPRLLIGTGFSGQLPIMDDVRNEAHRRGIAIVAVPTADACRLLADWEGDVAAVLHVTC